MDIQVSLARILAGDNSRTAPAYTDAEVRSTIVLGPGSPAETNPALRLAGVATAHRYLGYGARLPKVSRNGLVAEYLFREGSGLTAADSAGGHDLALRHIDGAAHPAPNTNDGSMNWAADRITGEVLLYQGNSNDFIGSCQNVFFPAEYAGDIGIECWLHTPWASWYVTLSFSDMLLMFSLGGYWQNLDKSTRSCPAFIAQMRDGDGAMHTVEITTGTVMNPALDPALDDLWAHYVVTFELATSTVRIFQNGALVKTEATSPVMVSLATPDGTDFGSHPEYLNDTRFLVGNSINAFDDGIGYRGTFGEIRLYRHALTQPEVADNYAASKARYGL